VLFFKCCAAVKLVKWVDKSVLNHPFRKIYGLLGTLSTLARHCCADEVGAYQRKKTRGKAAAASPMQVFDSNHAK
jgi:hypothetical protein